MEEDVTSRLKFPLTSVIIPLVVPFSITFAPIIGSPLRSVTFPEICFVCCRAGCPGMGSCFVSVAVTDGVGADSATMFCKGATHSNAVANFTREEESLSFL